MDIPECVGEEIFFVGLDGDVDNGDFDIFMNFEELNNHLKRLSPSVESGIMVIHGVLATAECIPEDITQAAYVIVASPDEVNTGCIYELLDLRPEKLTNKIEEILETRNDEAFHDLGIENIYVLYGYELNLGFHIANDEVDEEQIVDCQRIADAANKMRSNLGTLEEGNEKEDSEN